MKHEYCYCLWFGQVIKMEVINYDHATGQHQVKHIDSYGSFWTYLEIINGISYEHPSENKR